MAGKEQIVRILSSYVVKSITIGFAIFLVVLVIWLLRKYETGSYWNAKRAQAKGDIGRAVMLYQDAVHEDTKLSLKALLRLEEMDNLVALEGLVNLIDVPKMNNVDHRIRKEMCDVIRERTSGTTADLLSLDPYASQDLRSEQKRQWQAWLSKAQEKYSWQNGKFVPKEGG